MFVAAAIVLAATIVDAILRGDVLRMLADTGAAVIILGPLAFKFWPSLYLLWRRTLAFFGRDTVLWTLKIVGTGNVPADYLARLDREIRVQLKGRAVAQSPHRRYYEIRRLAGVEVILTPFDEVGRTEVAVRVEGAPVAYAYARSTFQHEAMGVVAALQEASRDESGRFAIADESLSLTIEYPGDSNPYYGMLLKWLGPGTIESLNAGIRLDDQTFIRVSRGAAVLTAGDRVRFEQAALDLLGLTGPVVRPAQPPA